MPKFPYDNKELWSFLKFEVLDKDEVRIICQNPQSIHNIIRESTVLKYLQFPYGQNQLGTKKNYEGLPKLNFGFATHALSIPHAVTVICSNVNRGPDIPSVLDTLTAGLARHYPNGLPQITRELTQSTERSPEVTILPHSIFTTNDTQNLPLKQFSSPASQLTPDNSDNEASEESLARINPEVLYNTDASYNTNLNDNLNNDNTINTNPALTPIYHRMVDLIEIPDLGIVTISNSDPTLVLNAYNELRALEQYESRFFSGKSERLKIEFQDNAVNISLKQPDRSTNVELEILKKFPHIRIKKLLDTIYSTVVLYEGDPNSKIILSWTGATHPADIKNIIERHIPPQMKNLFNLSPEGNQALSVRLNFQNRGEYPPLTDFIKAIFSEEQKLSQQSSSKKRQQVDIDLTQDTPPTSPRRKK